MSSYLYEFWPVNSECVSGLWSEYRKKETWCHDLYQSLQVTEEEYKIAIPKTAENLLEG